MNAKRPLIMLTTLLVLASGSALAAKPWWMRGVESNETDFLPPDVAFRAGARLEGGTLLVRWVIADGYYLYKQKITVVAESPDLIVTGVSLPPGTLKTDPYLGTQEIYKQQVEGTVAYRRFDYGAHPLQVKVTYQGCAEAGLCYPPITKVLWPSAGSSAASAVAPSARPVASYPWEGFAIGGGVLAFLAAGLLLRKTRTLPLPAA
ncbi:MAG TPA: protein-disulfide reductase DsbD domain-containing protein [Steroidobacteraceae bacterium]|jgi:thiol:disulfide interchange protein DsbD|nr:protein-disulfide reductase DsbD domain-containing protein [Steroidobacteraceae bacterium]